MNLRTLALAACLGAPLLACSQDRAAAPAAAPDATTATPAPSTSVIRKVANQAMAEVRDEMAHGNITLDHDNKAPKAEITPQGDLLIGGQALALTPAQRQHVLAYRAAVAEVAIAGAEVGMEGADLAVRAMGEAFKGVLSGNPDAIEAKVEAEAAKVKASARRLCDRLPALKSAQDALAAAVPEFAPYADMEQHDIDECWQESADGHATHASTAAEAEAASAPKQ